jgi:hypothetical protein
MMKFDAAGDAFTWAPRLSAQFSPDPPGFLLRRCRWAEPRQAALDANAGVDDFFIKIALMVAPEEKAGMYSPLSRIVHANLQAMMKFDAAGDAFTSLDANAGVDDFFIKIALMVEGKLPWWRLLAHDLQFARIVTTAPRWADCSPIPASKKPPPTCELPRAPRTVDQLPLNCWRYWLYAP